MSEIKKFSPMRYTAATEAAAVEGALLMAGVAREDADYDILEQSEKGVTVRIRPRESGEAAPVVPQPEVFASAPEIEAEAEIAFEAEIAEAEAEVFEDEVELDFDDEDEADDEDLDEEEDEEEELEEAYASEELLASETDAEPAQAEAPNEPDVVLIDITDEMRERAQSGAQAMLEKMGLHSSVALKEATQPNTIALDVEGEDVGILIGKHGQTLQSFQYLLNLTLNNAPAESGEKMENGVRVVVDAGNYKARRQNSLENTAKNAAQRARMSGRPFRLEPMTASERRIVHLFLSRENGISTQSEGREPRRRIVVFPTDSVHSTYDRQEARATRRGSGMGNYGSRGGRGGRR